MEEVCEFKLNAPLPASLTEETIATLSLRVKTSEVASAVKAFKDRLFSAKGVRSVVSSPDNDAKLLLFDASETPAALSEELKALGIEGEFAEHKVTVRKGMKEILTGILPPSVPSPSGFEILGEVALIYLRPAQSPYRFAIGQAVLLSQPKLRAVANKSEKLSNEFRVPELELIAGEAGFETSVLEGKVRIKLDPSRVYYCSKLEHERSRILGSVGAKETIADVFCGVGPFALRAAKEKGCTVLANDLNPSCFEFLKANVASNKLAKLVDPNCGDGREFVRGVLKKWREGELKKVDRFFMNLPGLAVEFLDAFGGREDLPKDFDSFRVDVYTFQENEEEERKTVEGVKTRVRESMGGLTEWVVFRGFHFVKNVSNSKAMVCASFEVFGDLSKAEEAREKGKEVISGDGKGEDKADGSGEMLTKRSEP